MNTTDAPDKLLLDYRLDNGVTVVKVTGEVDVPTSSSIRNSLLRVIHPAPTADTATASAGSHRYSPSGGQGRCGRRRA
jgi:hypothetical protein